MTLKELADIAFGSDVSQEETLLIGIILAIVIGAIVFGIDTMVSFGTYLLGIAVAVLCTYILTGALYRLYIGIRDWNK